MKGLVIIFCLVSVARLALGAVKCDATHECPTGNTCCKTATGQWGCCPLPNAVCCTDHVHCCPNGYKCEVSSGKCNKGSDSISWVEKQPALTRLEAVKCDATHECPTGNTCCKTATGQWGCCPLPNAVCCTDHVHCCPNGYKCEVSSGKCNKGSDSIFWVEKQPAIHKKKVKPARSVPCDASHDCPDNNTCCKLPSGQFGCCPVPDAVCCNDHVHCCPSGYTCDTTGGKCDKGRQSVPWLEKQPARISRH